MIVQRTACTQHAVRLYRGCTSPIVAFPFSERPKGFPTFMCITHAYALHQRIAQPIASQRLATKAVFHMAQRTQVNDK